MRRTNGESTTTPIVVVNSESIRSRSSETKMKKSASTHFHSHRIHHHRTLSDASMQSELEEFSVKNLLIQERMKRRHREDSIQLESQSPGVVLQTKQAVRVDDMRTFIIGYGFEMEGVTLHRIRSTLPRRSISYTESLEDLMNQQVPETGQQNLLSQSETDTDRVVQASVHPSTRDQMPLHGKKFSYTLRGHVVMYDRWGFGIFGGSDGKSRVQEDNMFDYERRRKKNSFVNVKFIQSERATEEHGCVYTATLESKPTGRCMTNMNKHRLRKAEKEIEMNDEVVTDEYLFVENDISNDIEQIKIRVNDPKEIHHLLLVLNFDAPPSVFLQRSGHDYSWENYLPKVSPYVRIIDADKGVEVVRYYLGRTPSICVALELDRVESAEERHKLEKLELNKLQDSLHVHIPSAHVRSRKDIPPSPSDDVSGPGTFAFSAFQPQSQTTVTPPEDSQFSEISFAIPSFNYSSQPKPVIHKSEEEIREEAIMQYDQVQKKLKWDITALKEEWHYQNHEIGDAVLTSFLNEVDLNQLGLRGKTGIPQRLPTGFRINIGKATGIQQQRKMFCVISTNDPFRSNVQRTRACSDCLWNSTFDFVLPHGFRGCKIVVDVYAKREEHDKLIGQIWVPFGIITNREKPEFEASFPISKTEPPYKGSVLGYIDMKIELLMEQTASAS